MNIYLRFSYVALVGWLFVQSVWATLSAKDALDPMSPPYEVGAVTWWDGCDYTISPSGKRVAIIQSGNSEIMGSAHRIFIIDPDAPKTRVQIGGVFLRGVSVLFSQADRWIVVNNSPVHGEATPILFQKASGIMYVEPKNVDANKQIRSLYAKVTGDVAGSKNDDVYLVAFNWKPDSSGFQVSVDTRYNNLKVQPWSAFYNVNTSTADLPTRRDDSKISDDSTEPPDHELNAMYKLVYGKLSSEAQQQLQLDERKWIKNREQGSQDESNARASFRIQQLFDMLPENH